MREQIFIILIRTPDNLQWKLSHMFDAYRTREKAENAIKDFHKNAKYDPAHHVFSVELPHMTVEYSIMAHAVVG